MHKVILKSIIWQQSKQRGRARAKRDKKEGNKNNNNYNDNDKCKRIKKSSNNKINDKLNDETGIDQDFVNCSHGAEKSRIKYPLGYGIRTVMIKVDTNALVVHSFHN